MREAGPALDAEVAERIMGYRWHEFERTSSNRPNAFTYLMLDDGSALPPLFGRRRDGKFEPDQYRGPNYSTSRSDALDVVDAIAAKGFHWKITSPFMAGEKWWAGFTQQGTTGFNGRPDFRASADNLAMAICLAALEWAEHPEDLTVDPEL